MKKILIVIDMQNDFIDGALGTKEAVSIVPNVVRKIQAYRELEEACILATRDTHKENYMETQEGQYLPVPHCIKGTKGWEIRPEILEAMGVSAEDPCIYNKPTFGSRKLAKAIRRMSKEEEIEIELVGLCTDICVVSNALMLKAFMPEVKISVDSACCAGVTPKKHEAALETMRSCQIQVQ